MAVTGLRENVQQRRYQKPGYGRSPPTWTVDGVSFGSLSYLCTQTNINLTIYKLK